jgi:hypothetical protein
MRKNRLLSLIVLAIFMSLVCATTVLAGNKESSEEKLQKQMQENALKDAIRRQFDGDPNT